MTLNALLARLRIDPFLIILAATVGLAALLPARGGVAPVMGVVTNGVVGLLFFVYGARLAPKAVLEGLSHWRLQSMVFASTFVLFPLLGLALTFVLRPFLPHEVSVGLMFVSVLPSTVQSSIAFTAIARGNVSAALCSASVSNLLGVLVTPALVGLLLNTHGAGFSAHALEDISLQLLAPFAAGQALRPLIGAWLLRHKTLTTIVDRGSVLIVVYAAFSEGMVNGIWSQVSLSGVATIVAADMVLLMVVLVATTVLSRLMGFSREDEIAIVFCGSKKSLAAGVPMAQILFPASAVGLVVLPLMLFHQIQLFACAALAQRYARQGLRAARIAPGYETAGAANSEPAAFKFAAR